MGLIKSNSGSNGKVLELESEVLGLKNEVKSLAKATMTTAQQGNITLYTQKIDFLVSKGYTDSNGMVLKPFKLRICATTQVTADVVLRYKTGGSNSYASANLATKDGNGSKPNVVERTFQQGDTVMVGNNTVSASGVYFVYQIFNE